MTADSPKEVSRLLLAWSDGDETALDKLVPLVYEGLRRLAHRYIRGERPGNTLQTTALAHEAYLRLVDAKTVRWQNRNHFFAVAAKVMRRILTDEQVGQVIKISPRTVRSEWRLARVWLYRELSRGVNDDS